MRNQITNIEKSGTFLIKFQSKNEIPEKTHPSISFNFQLGIFFVFFGQFSCQALRSLGFCIDISLIAILNVCMWS